MEVDLGHELALRRVGRAGNMVGILAVGVVVVGGHLMVAQVGRRRIFWE